MLSELLTSLGVPEERFAEPLAFGFACDNAAVGSDAREGEARLRGTILVGHSIGGLLSAQMAARALSRRH